MMPKKTEYIIAVCIGNWTHRAWTSYASEADKFGKAMVKIAKECPSSGIEGVVVADVMSDGPNRFEWGKTDIF